AATRSAARPSPAPTSTNATSERPSGPTSNRCTRGSRSYQRASAVPTVTPRSCSAGHAALSRRRSRKRPSAVLTVRTYGDTGPPYGPRFSAHFPPLPARSPLVKGIDTAKIHDLEPSQVLASQGPPTGLAGATGNAGGRSLRRSRVPAAHICCRRCAERLLMIVTFCTSLGGSG